MKKSKKRRTKWEESPFSPGSMVDKSIRIGYDVRDLIVMGYTDEDIDRAARGEITLEELFEQGPSPRKPTAIERLFTWLSSLLS